MPLTIARALLAVNVIRWAGFVTAVIGGGVFLATAMDRGPVLAFAGIEGELGKKVYRPGDTISGSWRVKALRACDADADRYVTVTKPGEKDWVYHLPPVPVRLTDYQDRIPGEIAYPITAFPLPPDTPTGEATYHHTDSYKCSFPGNSLFPIVQQYPVIHFRVEAP